MISISHLYKSYGDKLVIEDLSVMLKEGHSYSLMGQSGCGKTTLAHILLGLTEPDRGSIEGLSGKRLSAVFQEDRLCEQLDPLKNIRLVLRQRIPDINIYEDLGMVGLDRDSITKPAYKLSGGQKRRIAIVRAMMADSDFICLDEPFKGLDRSTKIKTMEYVKGRSKGKTVLFITHDISEALFFNGEQLKIFEQTTNE